MPDGPDASRHPVFFARDRVRLCMRIQGAMFLLALILFLSGAACWISGGPGWMVMLSGVALAVAAYAFGMAWRLNHETQWWGGKRGMPRYLE
jgi:hypothetical protein